MFNEFIDILTMETKISSEIPFESKYIEIEKSKIHYIDVGKGDLYFTSIDNSTKESPTFSET